MIYMKELNQNTTLIKILACFFMIIDHIGIVFFPKIVALRWIGRLAFPLFFYSTFIGYFKTKDLKKYIFRLFALGTISQIPYYILIGNHCLNVCFTFIIELIFLYFLDNKKYIGYFIAFTISLLLLPIVEYLPIVLFLTPIFYYSKNTKTMFSISYSLFYILITFSGYNIMYITCLLNVPLLIFNIKTKIKINKYFFYVFYPAHLIVLYLIKIFF